MKSWLEKNNIEVYSTHRKGKSVVAERFIRTLKNKIYKYKPGDIKSSRYTDFSKEINDEDPKFKIGDIVRISKYKNIFAKGYIPSWSEEVFVIKKVKNAVPGMYVISDPKGEEIFGTFYEKELRIAKNKSKRV